jgi:cation:H+ antiporter
MAAAMLMIWRLEAMSAGGFEGTVLGTLVMPYCSGIGNLIFAFLIAHQRGPGGEVMTNAIVNNVTNLTLLLGLPAIFWQSGKSSGAKGKSKKAGASAGPDTGRFSVMLTLLAVLFFTGALWALGRDGQITFNDGLVLAGLFLFWQTFHVFEVLKTSAANGGKSPGWKLGLNFALLGAGAYVSYVSIDWLVAWLLKIESGFISAQHLGWLSGWMMVLPNAILALYYGWRRRSDVVYASQVGDGHICIPLCVGIFALHQTLKTPEIFLLGVQVIAAAAAVHFLFIATLGRLPRVAGFAMVVAYGYFLKTGLLK